MGEEDDERGLAEHGGLAGHVRPGDDEQFAPLLVQVDVVGHEPARLQGLLDHRVAALGDGQVIAVVDLRPAVAVADGDLRQAGGHVDLRQMVRSLQQPLAGCGQLLAHCGEQFVLQFQAAFLGGTDVVFQLLEFRGDEPLGIDQGLLADEVVGKFGGLAAAQFEIIAEHPVVADLEASKARALPLPPLQFQDHPLAVAQQDEEPVQFLVEPFADQVAFPQTDRRIVADGRLDQDVQVGEFVELFGQPPEQGRGAVSEQPSHLGQAGQAGLDGGHVAGVAVAEHQPAAQPLQVVDRVEQRAHGGARLGPVDQLGDTLQPRRDPCPVLQRKEQPAAQQAGAHGGGRAVQGGEQGPLTPAADNGLGDLQVAARGLVDDEEIPSVLGSYPLDVGEVGLLRLLDVAEQGAGRVQGRGVAFAAEAGQVGDAEVFGEGGARRSRLEMKIRPRGEAEPVEGGLDVPDQVGAVVHVRLRQQQFGGSMAADLVKQRRRIVRRKGHLGDLEAAGGHIEKGEPGQPVAARAGLDGQAADVAVRLLVEQLVVRGHPR